MGFPKIRGTFGGRTYNKENSILRSIMLDSL